MLKARVRTTFGHSDVVSRGRRKGLCTASKVSKTWGFSSNFKSVGRRGTYAEDMARFIWRGRRSTRDMFIGDVRRSGRWFPENGCILEHQIFSFGEMILRDRCSTSYDLASLFCGRRNTLDRKSGKVARRIGTRPSALHSFPLLKEVSQNCCIFDVVINVENWGSLAELLRFVLDVVKFKIEEVSPRIAALLMLSSSKAEEVLQNIFVLKFADRQTDRQTDRQIDR